MKPANRFLAMLLSALLLVTPVFAHADGADGGAPVISVTISDPYLTIQETGYDLSGLALALQAASGENSIDIALDVLLQGVSALSGYVSVNETGLSAILSGMTSAIGVSAESISGLLGSLGGISMQMPDMSGAADMGSVSPVDEATLNALKDVLSAFGKTAMSGEGAEDTVSMGEMDVPCTRYDFTVSNEQYVALITDLYGILETIPAFAAGVSAGLSASGMEVTSVTDTIAAAIAASGLSTDGSVYITEAGDMVAVGTISAASDDEITTIPYEMARYSDENGALYYTCTLSVSETDSFEVYASLTPSETVEGVTELYMELGAWTVEDGEAVSPFSFTAMTWAEATDDGVENAYVFTVAAGGSTYEFDIYYTKGAESDSVAIYFDMTQGEGEDAMVSSVNFTYDGTAVADGDYQGIDGSVYIWADQNEVVLFDLSFDIAAGVDLSGESIAFDYASVPVIDIAAADEETSAAVQGELMTSLYGLLANLQTQVPGFAELMNSLMSAGAAATDGAATTPIG